MLLAAARLLCVLRLRLRLLDRRSGGAAAVGRRTCAPASRGGRVAGRGVVLRRVVGKLRIRLSFVGRHYVVDGRVTREPLKPELAIRRSLSLWLVGERWVHNEGDPGELIGEIISLRSGGN